MGVAFRDSIIFGVHVLAQSIANIVVVDFFHARLHLSEFRHYIRTFVTFCPFHRYYQFIGALAFNDRKISPVNPWSPYIRQERKFALSNFLPSWLHIRCACS